MRHRTRLSSPLIALVLAAGCGGDGDTGADPPPDEATDAGGEADAGTDAGADDGADDEAAAGGAEVAIEDGDGRRFSPAEVSVSVGDTVTWTHDGSLPHTVTATDGSFDSGNLASGDTFEFAAESAGTVQYVCSIHSDMTGTVTVS